MRIGLDFHVVDGAPQGSRSHLLGIYEEVIRNHPEKEFYIFIKNDRFIKRYSPVFRLSNVKVIKVKKYPSIIRLMLQLPLLCLKYKINILHCQYNLPLILNCKSVVTIHDVLFESHPKFFNFFQRLRLKILVRVSSKISSHIATVSNFSKNEIVKRYGVTRDKISVIYNAVDKKRFFPGLEGLDIIKRKNLESKNYLLSVGRIEPRKNYLGLISAYSQSKNFGIPLVIIGTKDFGYNEFSKYLADNNFDESILFFDDVSDEDLPAFYRHAKFFLYISFAEGFGMPLLEAMASGVPVITSDTSALTEVAHDAAILINPHSSKEIVNAIDSLFSSCELSDSLSNKGIKRVDDFLWRVQAERMIDIYDNL